MSITRGLCATWHARTAAHGARGARTAHVWSPLSARCCGGALWTPGLCHHLPKFTTQKKQRSSTVAAGCWTRRSCASDRNERRTQLCRCVESIGSNASHPRHRTTPPGHAVAMASAAMLHRACRDREPVERGCPDSTQHCGRLRKRLEHPLPPAAGRRLHAVRPERHEPQQHAQGACHGRGRAGRGGARALPEVRRHRTHAPGFCSALL